MGDVRVAQGVDAARGVRPRCPARRGSDDDARHLPVDRAEQIRARWADPRHLREEQYASSANLDARIELHRRFSTNPQGWPRWFFEQLEAPRAAHVLDVGCGPGLVWAENRDRVPNDWSVTLVDLSPGMVEAARERLGDATFRFDVADAQELPFDDGSFDVAMANHMLYHVPDQSRAIRELRRVARVGGRVYVSTVGASHMRELHLLVEGRSDAPLRFLLENGAEALERVFDEVELRLYEDSLEVTEVEPILAVIRSSVAGDLVDDEELGAIRQRVDERLRAEGVFRIEKSSGVFVCR